MTGGGGGGTLSASWGRAPVPTLRSVSKGIRYCGTAPNRLEPITALELGLPLAFWLSPTIHRRTVACYIQAIHGSYLAAATSSLRFAPTRSLRSVYHVYAYTVSPTCQLPMQHQVPSECTSNVTPTARLILKG